MKEYKMMQTSKKEAEALMNKMAAEGWNVTSVTYWSYWWTSLLITFERDKYYREVQ